LERTSTSTQKVNINPSCAAHNDALAKLSVGKLPGENAANNKPVSPEANRRVRTSAAMIGLAISMGASGLCTHKGAIAAEHQGVEPAGTTPKSTVFPQTIASSQQWSPVSPVPLGQKETVNSSTVKATTENKVQTTQTLWQLPEKTEGAIAAGSSWQNSARLSQSSVSADVGSKIATNQSQVSPQPVIIDSVKVGNAPQIPVTAQTIPNLPARSGNVVNFENTDQSLKAQQDAALSRLKQQRSRLQNTLSQLTGDNVSDLQPTKAFDKSSLNQQTKADLSSGSSVGNTSTAKAPVTISVIPPATPTTSVKSDLFVAPKPVEASQPVNIPVIPAQKPAPETKLVAVPKVVTDPEAMATSVTPVETASNGQVEFSSVVVEPLTTPISRANKQLTYQVQVGDTLQSIATTYGVSTTDLIRVNALNNTDVVENQTLKIPTLKTKPVTPAVVAVKPEKIAIVKSSQTDNVVKQSVPVLVQPAKVDTNPYVDKLRQDIVKLREQYRSQSQSKSQSEIASSSTISEEPAVIIPVVPAQTITPDRQNPEFTPSNYNRMIKNQNPVRVQTNSDGETVIPIAVEPPPAVPQSRKIAAAPTSSDRYNPSLRTPVGTTVSPELPDNNSNQDPFSPNNVRPFAGYIWPAKGVLTSGYGWRWGRMHKGIDIAAPIGTPVVAAADGEIVYARWNSGGYGNLVDIRHPDGSVTRYAHNNRILVKEGQYVAQGQQIAEMGSTGFSTGPHTHFEIHPGGQGAVNPIAYLPRRRSS
jgi:murein DD-endopeptidase MepM/ murein hydrolase activator NlpD